MNAEKHFFYAIDIRKDEMLVGLYDLSGNRKSMAEIETGAKSRTAEHVVGAALSELDNLARAAGVSHRLVKAVGISVPGTVDRRKGWLLDSAVLGWKNTPIYSLIDAHFSRHISRIMDKNANSALRAELVKGDMLPDNLTGVFVEIGGEVESAIILDGKILSGFPYGSGSFGRTSLLVKNGSNGLEIESWQNLVSIPALMSRCDRCESIDRKSQQNFLVELRTRLKNGDRQAVAAVSQEARMLALGFCNIFLFSGLPNIVVGGTIRRIWDILEKMVHTECKRLLGTEFPSRYRISLMTVPEYEFLEGAAIDAIGTVVPLELISQIAVQQKAAIEKMALGITPDT